MAILDVISDIGKTVAQVSTDIGKTVAQKSGEIGKSVAQKTGEIAESSKLAMDIKKKEKDIRTLQFEIGKYVYQQYKNDQSFDEKIMAFCNDIDSAYEEIEGMENERQTIGAEDADVEVVEPDIEDDEINITPEDEEILNNL